MSIFIKGLLYINIGISCCTPKNRPKTYLRTNLRILSRTRPLNLNSSGKYDFYKSPIKRK